MRRDCCTLRSLSFATSAALFSMPCSAGQKRHEMKEIDIDTLRVVVEFCYSGAYRRASKWRT